MPVAAHVHYSGSVQGVGFRYTTVRLAGRHDVAGFVKNLPDGRVELVAEGEPTEVDAFLAAVEDAMGAYIRDARRNDEPPSGRYDGFDVAY